MGVDTDDNHYRYLFIKTVKEADPQVKLGVQPQAKDIADVRVRQVMPNIDDLLDRKADEEILGRDYKPWEDPEDLDTYLDQYQNDY